MRDGPILLVEDNPDDVALTLRAFAKNGVRNEIIVAFDGEMCLDRLFPKNGTEPIRPAMILLDIHLPKIDGLELLRLIRASEYTLGLPVIMLTTSNEPRDVVKSYRLGANSFVRKPVAFNEFLQMVDTLSTYWLRVNEPLPMNECNP